MRAIVVLAALTLLASTARAQELTHWPPEAEKRFEEARDLAQRGHYADAAARYREVADWPAGGPFVERAQSLFCSALNLENGRELEKALAAYREVARRFAGTDWANRASQAAGALDPEGARGLEFRRRQNEAWDVFQPATVLVQSGKLEEARPGLERAQQLFFDLLKDHPEHPRASDVALALGDVRMKLQAFGAAITAYERAIELARREALKPGTGHPTDDDVKNAEEKLAEAHRAIRRQLIDRGAKVLLAAIAVVVVSSAPWRRVTVRTAWLASGFGLGMAALTVVGVMVAEYIRRNVDDHSPIEDGHAALLVLVPGVVGVVTALGLSSRRSARGAAAGALVGMLAAFAAAVVVVYACGLFPFLDSEL